MSRYFVNIERDGSEPGVLPWTDQQEAEYFKSNDNTVWGIVEADDQNDAIQKLLEYCYENELWYH